MRGSKFCGSHQNWTPPTPTVPRQCAGTKKNGERCQANAQHGSAYCGPHNRTITTVEAPPTPAAPPVAKRWHDTPPRTFGPFDPRGIHVRYDNGRWWEPERD